MVIHFQSIVLEGAVKCYFFFVVLGFELRALCLVVSAMPLALFALVIFQMGSHFYAWETWITIFLLMLSTQCVSSHLVFY
jgi:hypothetical protein